MPKTALVPDSVKYMEILMNNETIANKVKAAGKEGRSYKTYRIDDVEGTVILGETTHWFWNQLIGCKRELTFESWALAVWDALVDLSSGLNAKALEEGLSVEIAKEAQRAEKYNDVVNRLMDCYRHVCNGDGQSSLAGDQRKSGSRVVVTETPANDTNIVVNVNTRTRTHTYRFPDATGRAFIDLEMGVVGAHISRD
jgi:hypothetical protein